ncbi:MAG TPA: PAS domain-containing sensor histidine kinase [Acidobacteriaceae bacterium]|nr:PAS domain-containing sensor histidine kinase [Acidobacteriaceae bacterium]
MSSKPQEPSFDGAPAAVERSTISLGGIDRTSGSLSEDRFRACAETSSDWFWEQDEELRFRWFANVNAPADIHAAEVAYGKTRWELVDRGVSEAEWISHKADLEARRPFHDFRFERLADDGTVHYVTVSARPFFDMAGNFRGYRGSCRDITDQIQAQRVVEAAIAAAEAVNRAKSEFLANMSHELRTPLNAVLGFAEMMRDNLAGDLAPRYSAYATNIHEAGLHLLDLINDILDTAKIESGHMALHDEPIDIVESIRTSCGILADRAAAGEVSIERSATLDLPPMRADPLRMKQILLNLCGNAIKFTPAGGTVRIEASHRAGIGFDIIIADTGTGMHAADVPKAVEPFWQAESSLSRRFGGTGLGLPIAKALTELHGGTLEIMASLGSGTIVTLHFPEERVVHNP